MLIKKNIWPVFYLIVVGGLLLFVFLSFAKYNSIKEAHKLHHLHDTQMFSQSIHSFFFQYELMIDILGITILENQNYKNRKKMTDIFNNIIKSNPNLAGLELSDTKGDVIAANVDIELSCMPNLLEDENAKDTFKEALESNRLILGRTYFSKALSKWLIPMRKAVRDENSKIIGVVTIALNTQDEKYFLNIMDLLEDKKIEIIKDKDRDGNMFRQYFNKQDIEKYDELYIKAFPNEIYTTFENLIKENSDLSMQELKENEKTVFIQTQNNFYIGSMTGIKYDEKYKLWTLVSSSNDLIRLEFLKQFWIYLFIFIISVVLIYRFFKYIAGAQKIQQDELLFQVMHDSLTKLPNRNFLYDYKGFLENDFSKKMNLLFIDLDNFKNVNDNFGHYVGDEILIQVAARMKEFFDETSLIVRYDGDEFIVLMPDDENINIEILLIELIEVVSRSYVVNNLEFNIGLSVGVSQFPKDAKDLESLMKLADIAMYEAKKIKNTYCIFSDEMKNKNIHKGDIERELRKAIGEDEFWMVYQPQMNADGSLFGVEALMRWQNGTLGFVGPDKFISVAEEAGMMVELGHFIISNALSEISKIQKSLNKKFQLSINISVRQLMEIGFLDTLLRQLNIFDISKHMLTLEITESLFIEDMSYVLPLLKEVENKGIKISLDDFGTGYSSLSVLRKLPISELKIDKSFIDEILNSSEDAALVESIIRMGKGLSMKILAEGTENLEQVDMLKEYGCDIFQGYYFARPLKSDALIQFIEGLDKKN